MITTALHQSTASHIQPERRLIWGGLNARRLVLAIPLLVLSAILNGCGGGGSSSSSSANSFVSADSTGTSSLIADCTASGCGAIDAGTYSGAGLGVWKYENTRAANAFIDINLNGLTSGQSVTLLYSNGTSDAISDLPGPTKLDNTLPNAVPSRVETLLAGVVQVADAAEADSAHAMLQQRNREAAQMALSLPKSAAHMEIAQRFLAVAPPAPDIGSSRTWIEGFNYSSPVNYRTSVRVACQLPSSRNVVIWLDESATAQELVGSVDMAAMQNTVCGSNGGIARLNALLGDVWGSNANPDLISDQGGLQDINIVVVAAPATTTPWAGYFWANNNYKKSYTANQYASLSNESLVFFINANAIKSDRNYALSTLLHEATHMTNFYQNVVKRGVVHDTWLEETSAMMTEDIVSPAVIPGSYNKIATVRLPSYLKSGGGVSYLNWPSITSAAKNYDLGGAFGAYLNRRFGIGLYQQLVTSCTSESTSYECLNALIKSHGGVSFADEFAHFGASAFGAISAANSGVAKYGFPAKVSNGYSLQAIDVASQVAYIPQTATPLTSTFPATSHTYLRETVHSSTYTRKGVTVPAQSTLIVVVQ